MTAIEWTEKTWNPVTGCTVTSPGCKNCYAMKMAGRLQAMNAETGNTPQYEGTTKTVNGKIVWTGVIGSAADSVWQEPLRRKKPTMYFVNSMGDLFHPNVDDHLIDRAFAVMALSPQHTFQILTKHPERMRDHLKRYQTEEWADLHAMPMLWSGLEGGELLPAKRLEDLHWLLDEEINQETGLAFQPDLWPNVWLGVSVEDQKRADERIPLLLETPAAVRFISAEPLLGPVDLLNQTRGGTLWVGGQRGCGGKHQHSGSIGDEIHGIVHKHNPNRLHHHHDERCRKGIDWVIVGGESGPDSRPMHPDWARSLRDQCAAAGVPFFFKQWGTWEPRLDRDIDDPDWRLDWKATQTFTFINLAGGIGFHGERVFGFHKAGKKAAGRLLDGVLHDAMPAAVSAFTSEVLR